MLAGREWFFETFSYADVYFYRCFRRGSLLKPDLSDFSNGMARLQRMERRASMQKLLAYEKQVQADVARAA